MIAFFDHLSVNEPVAVDDTHNEEWIILCGGKWCIYINFPYFVIIAGNQQFHWCIHSFYLLCGEDAVFYGLGWNSNHINALVYMKFSWFAVGKSVIIIDTIGNI